MVCVRAEIAIQYSRQLQQTTTGNRVPQYSYARPAPWFHLWPCRLRVISRYVETTTTQTCLHVFLFLLSVIRQRLHPSPLISMATFRHTSLAHSPPPGIKADTRFHVPEPVTFSKYTFMLPEVILEKGSVEENFFCLQQTDHTLQLD